MRAHVECIDQRDYIWHMAEFVGAEGKAQQKNLSYDEEDGSASLQVKFASNWGRPAGIHHAETEWFILSGEVTIGGKQLVAGDYWMAPTGVWTPEITVKEGTEILLYRDYGDWGFDVEPEVGKDRHFVRADQKLVIKTAVDEWVPVEIGSPMRFDLGGTPVPGLYIKMLHRDEKTGHYTRLIKAKAGWKEHPLAHHPVYEESYCLGGSFEYNFGSMWPGSYSFRPAFIRHGDFSAGDDDGCTWIIRCDGDLVDWYTTDARLVMEGTPTNYGPDKPWTMMPKIPSPVRSRSMGPMPDPTYQ
jgi:hypothetical protein